MKIKSMLVGMLACTAMVSCTNDDLLENNNEMIQAGEKGYVAVNIVTPGSVTGRSTFEDGLPQESAVRDAIFLFLDGNYKGCAKPFYITSKDADWSAVGEENDGFTKKATYLVVDGIKDEVPAYIVAILNPINKDAYTEKTSLKNLKDEYANYASANNGGYFVMSNSVYNAANNKEVVATPIALENIARSKDDLKKETYKPVKIHVERTVGKVIVDKLDSAIEKLNKEGLTETIDNAENMKLKFVLTGWEVLQNKGTKLIKNIDATDWTIQNYLTGWNAPDLYRSYWANDYKGKDRTKYLVEELSGANGEYKYIEETVNQNAHAMLDLSNDNDKTSPYLLVSGKFVNENNQPVDLVEWMGQKYTKQGYLNLVAGMASVSKYYYINGTTTNEEGETVNLYKSLSADHLEMIDNPNNDWGATAELKKDAPQFYTVTFGADGKTIVGKDEANVDDVKDAIAEFGEVKYWNGGNTYYFVPIQHQAATAKVDENTPATNFYGVVRNHVYKMNISKINGYGTPVADPTQAIDKPENPEEGDTYMNAEVVILDWKVVSNDVELN